MNRLRRMTTVLVMGAMGLGIAPAAHPADGETDTRLAVYYQQRVDWHGCQRGPWDDEGRALDEAGARCAGVTVPLDYSRPGARTIKVAISRMAATDTGHRIGPLIMNLGGPGIPVLGRVAEAAQVMGATGARFDLIAMDPRFVGRSTPVDCGWPGTWIPRSAGADRESFNRMVALSRRLAHLCQHRHGDVLQFASTANMARDMDVVRGALREPRLSYLGYSYGSYLGATYTQLFPERADRIVLDSAIDPTDVGLRVRGDSGPPREAALRTWATWAARHDAVYRLGATQTEVLSLIDRIYRASARHPLRIGGHDVDDTVVAALLLNPLSDDGDYDQDQLARFVQALAAALEGGHHPPSADLDVALAGILTGAESRFHSGQTVIICADARVPRDPRWYWQDVQQRRARAPLFGVLQRISPCAFWPVEPRESITIRNSVPALIVHADGDIGATPELNQAMHRALAASRLITLDNVRTHGVYLFRGAPCVDNAVNDYLNTGALPDNDFHCDE